MFGLPEGKGAFASRDAERLHSLEMLGKQEVCEGRVTYRMGRLATEFSRLACVVATLPATFSDDSKLHDHA